MPSRPPILIAALTSFVVHAVLVAAVHWSAGTHDREEPPEVVVDLDIAPAPPEAFDPLDRPAAPEPPSPQPPTAQEAAAEKNAEPTNETTLEPAPDLEEQARKEEAQRQEAEKRRREEAERAEREAKERAEREAKAKAARQRKAREAREAKARAEEAEERARLAQSLADAGPMDAQAAVAEHPADAGATPDEALAAGTKDAGAHPEAPGVAAAPLGTRGVPGVAAAPPGAPGVAAAPPGAPGVAAAPPGTRGVPGARGGGTAPSVIGAGASTSGAAGSAVPTDLPPGASADLRTYAPDGDKLAVLLRYDRLRGTPWAALADAIIAPMPDYRSIIGDRKVSLADLFQSLLISSRNPANVTATHLVARTHVGAAELRRLLDHSAQRVTWQAVRGGVLGRREASEHKLERDHRVYLMPVPGVVVLTAPKHLGVLVERPPGGRTELDGARAAEADLPPWLARARSVDSEAGVDSDVIAVVTVAGLRRDEIALPELGSLPTPERFSLALEMAKVGFYVRGTMVFSTPELAEAFETRLEQGRKQLLASRFRQIMLKNLHAFHALQGLALRRRGSLVTYATSISNADAKAAMKLAAEWSRRYFESPAAEPEEPPGAPPGATPQQPAPPAPAPGDRKTSPPVTPGAPARPPPP